MGEGCAVDLDCGTDGWEYCDTDLQKCVHKKLYPMKTIEIYGIIVMTIMIMMAVIAGIGGGGIMVPLLMIFFNMQTKEAAAVSGFTIWFGSIIRYSTNFNQRHPDKDAVAIDYGLSNLMLPTVLVGSVSGVFLN